MTQTETPTESGITNADHMYQKAVCCVLSNRLASVALVQRHLKLGYAEALHLMESMVQAGVVSEKVEEDGCRRILWSESRCASYLAGP